jgi:zinc/manganese transport system permease protein
MSFMELLREPFVQRALWVGAVVAVVSGAIGLFVVVRGMSFAVHAVSELGFTGAAAALVLGVDPIVGLLVGSLAVGGILGLLTVRGRERDSAIGSFLAFGLGIGVLLISLYQGYATQATSLLFGSIVGVSKEQLKVTVVVAIVVLGALGFVYRPLLFASLDPEGAEARGVSLRLLSVVLLLLVALATAEVIQVVGVLLVLTLVITPAAAATRLTARPSLALIVSIGIAVVATEGGILLSLMKPYPTSFFISTLSFTTYVVARALSARRYRGPGRRSAASGAVATAGEVERDLAP